VVLGGALVAGEMVVLEEDHELSRHGTEPQLQIYSHFSATLSVFVCAVRVVKAGGFHRVPQKISQSGLIIIDR
jgi:hypothetical protein